MPTTLWTFATPQRTAIADFLASSVISNVSDPVAYSYNALSRPAVKLRLSQVGLKNSTDLSSLDYTNLILTAPSDALAYTVPIYDATAHSTTNTARGRARARR